MALLLDLLTGDLHDVALARFGTEATDEDVAILIGRHEEARLVEIVNHSLTRIQKSWARSQKELLACAAILSTLHYRAPARESIRLFPLPLTRDAHCLASLTSSY